MIDIVLLLLFILSVVAIAASMLTIWVLDRLVRLLDKGVRDERVH